MGCMPRENCHVSFGSRLSCERLSFQRSHPASVLATTAAAQDHDHHLAALLRDAPSAGLTVRRLAFEPQAAVEHDVVLLEFKLDEEVAAQAGGVSEPFLGLD